MEGVDYTHPTRRWPLTKGDIGHDAYPLSAHLSLPLTTACLLSIPLSFTHTHTFSDLWSALVLYAFSNWSTWSYVHMSLCSIQVSECVSVSAYVRKHLAIFLSVLNKVCMLTYFICLIFCYFFVYTMLFASVSTSWKHNT